MVMMHQPYAPPAIEEKILVKLWADVVGEVDDDARDFISKLLVWAQNTRKVYENNEFTDLISTRRLVAAIKCYNAFKSRRDAVELVVERFDAFTRQAFIDFYKAVDESFEESESVLETE